MRYLKPDLLGHLAGAYVLGTLTGRARRRFARLMKAHAAIAQAVRAWEQRLTPLALAVPPVAPPARVWKAVRARIGATPATSSGITQWFRELLAAAASVRWTLAAQAMAIAGLAVTLAITQMQRPEFETFSTPPPAATTTGHLRLVFAETASEKDIRTLLHSIGGTIVDGPGEMGIYTVALSDPATVNTALTALHRHPHVTLAQPVSNP